MIIDHDCKKLVSRNLIESEAGRPAGGALAPSMHRDAGGDRYFVSALPSSPSLRNTASSSLFIGPAEAAIVASTELQFSLFPNKPILLEKLFLYGQHDKKRD